MLRFFRVRPALWVLPLAAVIAIWAGVSARGQNRAVEPIAYVGHGAMFTSDGSEIEPTAAFIRKAQAWYLADLQSRLDARQRKAFQTVQTQLIGDKRLDGQSKMIVDSFLIDWLIKTVKPKDAARLQGKNNVLKFYLRRPLPAGGEKYSFERPGFRLAPDLAKRLKAAQDENAARPGAIALTTGVGGQDYIDLCAAQGVPIPPDINSAGWTSRGEIPQSSLFIARGLRAEVMTWESSSPAGMCIALPRFSGSTVGLDGVICVGKASGKVCFWDNQEAGGSFEFGRTEVVPFDRFAGGSELIGDVGGVCSDCHSGENPYVIHDSPLEDLEGIPLPTFPDVWPEPIVRTGDTLPWPENPGPMNSPPSCVGCHGSVNSPSFAGRLPHLSKALPSYCGTVLRTAIGAAAPANPGTTKAPPTMPMGAPGSLTCTPGIGAGDPRHRACTPAMTGVCTPDYPIGDPRRNDPVFSVGCTPEMQSLLSWCGLDPADDAANRGDPHITTFNGVNYDFQAAGEFVALRSATGVEIQTRQSPVSSAGVGGANPYTGIASCVSVNTAVAARVGKARVTYQPNLSGEPDPRGMQLRIDGRLRTLGSGVLGLPGGGRIVKPASGDGIVIEFPDKTRLIVTPAWWSAQSVWYLNVDVVNSTAREGIMGAILPGSWLPLLADGTPTGARPVPMNQRFAYLYKTFANSWRVKDDTSLFDYAPGTSTKTFTNTKWPSEKPPCVAPGSTAAPAEPIPQRVADKLCIRIQDKAIRAQCVFDVMVTGDPGFAKTYLRSEQLRAMALAEARPGPVETVLAWAAASWRAVTGTG